MRSSLQSDVSSCPLSVFIALGAFSLALPTGIQIPVGSFLVYPSEIAIYFSASALLIQRGVVDYASRRALALLVTFIGAAAITTIISDSKEHTITAARNIVPIFVGMYALNCATLSAKQLRSLLSIFLFSSVACSIWGILQALFGFSKFPNIYDLHLADANKGINLLGIVAWKYNLLQTTHIVPWQRTLAVGFSPFSGVFGACLAGSIAVSMYFYTAYKQETTRYIAFSAIMLLAILLSASRIPTILSAGVIIPLFLIVRTRNIHLKALLILALSYSYAFAIWKIFASGAFAFDGYGTVAGRLQLTSGCIDAWLSGTRQLMFGGSSGEFYSHYGQSPHNVFVYLLMHFGLFGAAPVIALILLTGLDYLRAARSSRDAAPEFRAAVMLGLAGTLWLLAYGMTWSVLESANEALLWVLLTGAPLSILQAIRHPRSAVPMQRPANRAAARQTTQPRIADQF